LTQRTHSTLRDHLLAAVFADSRYTDIQLRNGRRRRGHQHVFFTHRLSTFPHTKNSSFRLLYETYAFCNMYTLSSVLRPTHMNVNNIIFGHIGIRYVTLGLIWGGGGHRCEKFKQRAQRIYSKSKGKATPLQAWWPLGFW
jgi:hypothetical protein